MKTIREYQEKVEYLFNLNHTALNQSYLEVTGSTCAELAAFYTYNIF
jgi:hypothetical protein